MFKKIKKKRDGPACSKTGQVAISNSFIDGWPTRPDPFLASHKRAGPKRAGLAVLPPLVWGVLFQQVFVFSDGYLMESSSF